MEPGKTSFFQALGVPTKIARGTIEITTDLKLVSEGAKVGASEATLLNMLNISPFTYGMGIAQVYDQGQTFPPSVLDIEEKQLMAAFASAIQAITTISLATNYPTLPSIMHTLVNGYKKVLAVAIETEYSWPEIDELKDRIANPDAYASTGPVVTETTTETAKEAPKEEEEEEKEDSEEEGLSFEDFSKHSTNTRQVLVVFSTKYLHRHKIPWKCIRNDKRLQDPALCLPMTLYKCICCALLQGPLSPINTDVEHLVQLSAGRGR